MGTRRNLWIPGLLSFGFLMVTLSSTAGCASNSREGWKMPYSDDDSTAAPEAFSSDMSVRKNMPHRTDNKPFEFYYKHCSTNGSESYYSKTSYDCTGPGL